MTLPDDLILSAADEVAIRQHLLLVSLDRKWWFSRTGTERTFGYVSTGSVGNRRLQPTIN